MLPSEILMREANQLEKDYARAKSNNGIYYCKRTFKELEEKIKMYRTAIAVLDSHKF